MSAPCIQYIVCMIIKKISKEFLGFWCRPLLWASIHQNFWKNLSDFDVGPFCEHQPIKILKDFVRFWCQPIDFLVSSYFWIPKTLNASWNFAVIRNVVQLTRKAPLQNVERYQKHTQIWLSKTLQIFLETQWAANDCFPIIKNVSGTCCEWNFRFYGTNLKKLYIIILYKICQLLLVQLFPKSSRYLKLSQKNTEISKSQLW